MMICRTSPDHQREFNHQSPVTSVVLHPNQGEIISSDEDGRIARWDLRMNLCTEHLVRPRDPPTHAGTCMYACGCPPTPPTPEHACKQAHKLMLV